MAYFARRLEIARHFFRSFRSLAYRGRNVFCPCCGRWFRRFLVWDPADPGDGNRVCPRCGAHSRHRALALFLENNDQLLAPGRRLLHLAPEECLRRIFKKHPGLAYVTADLDSSLADVRTDLTALEFPDQSFDTMVCLHVLEHIADDRRAMNELFRVLKPGGTAIVQVPIDHTRAVTYEDPAVTALPERRRVFGQADHVRICGADYPQRLAAAGFIVTILDVPEAADPAARVKFGLMLHEPFFVCTKSGQPDAAREDNRPAF